MYSVDKCSHGDASKIHPLCRRTCIEKMHWWIVFLSIYAVILRRYVVRLLRQIYPMFWKRYQKPNFISHCVIDINW